MPQAIDEVGIGDERAAERDGVGGAALDGFDRLSSLIISVEDQRTAEDLANGGGDDRHVARSEGAVGPLFAQVKIGEAARIERGGCGGEQSLGIAVVGALRIAVGRQPDAGTVGADLADHGVDHLGHQADAVFDRAAIGVGAVVGVVAKKLVDQIAVRGVDLDAVEAGAHRVGRRHGVLADEARDFRCLERARIAVVDPLALAAIGPDAARRAAVRGGHRRRAAEEVGVHQPTHVPQLQDDASAGVVHRLGDRSPALDLRVGPDAGRVDRSLSLRRDAGRLADDQAGRGALAIIVPHQSVGHAGLVRPAARQRRHDDPVRRLDRAVGDGVEQAGHRKGLVLAVGTRRWTGWTRPPRPATA